MFAGRERPARPERAGDVPARRPPIRSTSQSGPDGDLYYADFDGGHDPADRVLLERTSRRSRPRPATPTSGPAPLQVAFDGTGRATPTGSRSPTPGISTATGSSTTRPPSQPTYTYTQPGTYSARLRVTDHAGTRRGTSQPITITANNTPPTATIARPAVEHDLGASATRSTSPAPRPTRSRGRCPGRRCAGTSSCSTARRTVIPHTITSVDRREAARSSHARPRVPVVPRASAHGDGRRRPDRHEDPAARSEDVDAQLRDARRRGFS